MQEDMWKKFENSGRIADYLNYKSTKYTNYFNEESEINNADNTERNCYKGACCRGQQKVY